tara:strand:- start:1392 stop:2033 length:642 start_codon:yes stop_codon:yes gene_type:complete
VAISNYTELAAAVQKYMVYDDISSEIDTLLPLAEAVLNREIRIRELQSSQQYPAQTTQTMTLPADFSELMSLYEEGESGGTLELVPSKLFWSRRDARTGSGQPVVYTVSNETITVAPTPDAARSYTANYYSEIPGLSGTQATNALLTRAPDVYLWSVLYQAAILVGDETLEAKYERNYEKAKVSLLAADNRARQRPGSRMRSSSSRDGRFKIA